MILERTPPQKRNNSMGNGEMNDSLAPDETFDHQQRVLQSMTGAEKSFVFPSLEDMAAPVRQKQQQQQQEHKGSVSVDGRRQTPSASASVSPSVSRSAMTCAVMRTSTSPNRSKRVSRSPQKPSVSPFQPKRFAKEPERQSVEVAAQSSTNEADRAFQEQIERAIASGENPFTDKRRAAMRDDEGAALLSTPILSHSSAAEQLRASPKVMLSHPKSRDASSTSPLASSSRAILDSSTPQQHSHKSVVNAAVYTGKAPEADHHSAPATLAEPEPAQDASRTPPAKRRAQSPLAVPPRAPSPPIALFTPRQRKSVSGKQAEIVPLAQQEEMHKLRAELRECKAQLRAAQMQGEQGAQECGRLKVRVDELEDLHSHLEETVAELQEQNATLDLTCTKTRFEAAKQSLTDRMASEEHKRQREIEGVIARNEITYLNARRVEAQDELEEAKGKQQYCGREWQEEVARLQDEVEKVRGEKKQIVAQTKQLEREREDWQEQLETLRETVERESTRRREIAQREARLRGQVDELQDALARESALRKEVAELKSSLAHERQLLDDEREKVKLAVKKNGSASTTTSTAAIKAPSPPSRTRKTNVENAKRQVSRRAMQAEVESSLMDQEDNESFEDLPPSPEMPPSKMTAAAKKTTRAKPVQEESAALELPSKAKDEARARPKPRAVGKASSRTAKTNADEEDESPEQPLSENKRAKKASQAVKAASSSKRAATTAAPVDNVLRQNDMTDDERDAEAKGRIPPLTVESIVPQSRKATSSVLSRNAAGKKASSSSHRPQSLPQQEAKNTSRPETLPSTSKGAPTAVFDETMKTPLLPTKRTRAVLNKRASATDEDDEEEENQANAKDLVPRKSDVTMATPMVRVDPTKKKKRKLLKAGTNVAGDFLTWKGDADGGLAPQLNLPIDLSPLKQGESDATAGKGRIGSGPSSHVAAASIFQHRR